MAIRLVPPAITLTLLAASCTSISVIPRYGQLDIDGHVGLNDASSGSTATNDWEAIGAQDDSSVPQGRLDLEVGGMHATFAYSESSHDGSGTLESGISDGTTTIPAGTPVDTDLDVQLGEAMVTWDLVPGDLVEVGIGLGASVFGLDAAFAAPSLTQSIDEDQVVPVPVLAVRAGLDFDRFDVSALFGGMDVRTGDVDASCIDLDVMARLKIFGAAGRRIGALVAGYRLADLSAEYEDSDMDVDVDVELSGPYIGLSLGF